MKTMQELISEYQELQAEAQAIDDKIDAKKQEMVRDHAPVRPGDEVPINSYAFRGHKMRVETVVLREDWRGMEFVARGFVVKKDGTTGSRRVESTYKAD